MEIRPGEIQQLLRIFLSYRSSELAAVDKFELPRLCHHRVRNLLHAVADEIYGRRAGEVEIALAAIVPEINTFSAHRRRKGFAERAPQKRGRKWDRISHISDYRGRSAKLSKI